MIEKKILILTGPKHSGKTSKLLAAIKSRTDVYGILSPIVNGERVFLDFAANETFTMEAMRGGENVIQVGKYFFSVSAFDRAVNLLKQAAEKKNSWLIIDEVGPLELMKRGFYSVMHELLEADVQLKIVLVVRDSILEEVIHFFELEKFSAIQIMTTEEFSLP